MALVASAQCPPASDRGVTGSAVGAVNGLEVIPRSFLDIHIGSQVHVKPIGKLLQVQYHCRPAVLPAGVNDYSHVAPFLDSAITKPLGLLQRHQSIRRLSGDGAMLQVNAPGTSEWALEPLSWKRSYGRRSRALWQTPPGTAALRSSRGLL